MPTAAIVLQNASQTESTAGETAISLVVSFRNRPTAMITASKPTRRLSLTAFGGGIGARRQSGQSGDRIARDIAVVRTSRIMAAQNITTICWNRPDTTAASLPARQSSPAKISAGTTPRATPSATAPTKRRA